MRMTRRTRKVFSAFGLASRADLFFARAVELVQRFEYRCGLMALDAVVDRLPGAVAVDQSRLFQLFQLLQHVGLGYSASLGKIARRPLPVAPLARSVLTLRGRL